MVGEATPKYAGSASGRLWPGVEGPSLMNDGVAMPVSFGAPILHAGQMMPPEYTPYKEKENV